MAQQAEWLPTVRTGSFFATASGGIGWGTPAAVGVALGDRDRGVERPVVGLIGDGSFQYSVQAIWTAAQHNLPIVYVVMRNHEYSILKSFAVLEETPGVPGLDLPGIDIASVSPRLRMPRGRRGNHSGPGAGVQVGSDRRHHDSHRGAHATPDGDAVGPAAPGTRARRADRRRRRRSAPWPGGRGSHRSLA
ncbi:hypothetical protein GCM10010211_55530 [Streptomyces albospinus]|uniref:Thiamine pyrophosphate enzyme TPP-binding domain-containing protein n=1 Tax=Streptomyces albospinus TaxID=285515 RepID=A0ABQ2VE47_9ACTN|nr:hypothetical protein GCM10010211_55530 [Streptomyces albospinus]